MPPTRPTDARIHPLGGTVRLVVSLAIAGGFLGGIQLGHAYLSTTRTYLERISSEEIIGAIHSRNAPMMHASAGLEL